MRRVIITPSFVDQDRLERHVKWLKYYLPLLNTLEVEKIIFLDNASNMDFLAWLGGNVYDLEFGFLIQAGIEPRLEIWRWPNFIGRGDIPGKGPLYPYWWRSYNYGHQLAMDQGYDVIIHNDTDLYLLTNKIVNFIKSLDSGYNSFWCPKYNFAETALTVLCRDSFPLMKKFMDIPISEHDWKLAELVLPFTKKIKDFKGDRYGETLIKQDETMDYYAQSQPSVELKFESEGDPNIYGGP